MSGVAQTILQPAARVERPARALLGWMQPNEALLMLTGRRQDVAPTDEQKQLVERLRDGVARRPIGIDQSGVEQPAPVELTPYLADLEKDQAAAGLIASGQGQAPQGPPVLGFSVAIVTSFVRIARYRERYILVDGYHRAHGFLRRGIKVVPAFVSEVHSFESLGLPPVGMLPQDAYLGDRPPLLADYLTDEVSAAVMV